MKICEALAEIKSVHIDDEPFIDPHYIEKNAGRILTPEMDN